MTEALLLTMMSPTRGGEAEFNDWVNTEHIPERLRIPGFRTALRFQNKAPAPRYLAIYDVDDEKVLQGEAYLAISGGNLSPWSQRVLAGATARWRFSGSRIGIPAETAPAPTGAKGMPSELLLVRWRGVPERCDETVASKLKNAIRDELGVIQQRVYAGKTGESFDYVGIVEATQGFSSTATRLERYSVADKPCDFAGVFVPLQQPANAKT
jgi:hypothetical protein